ncbi:cyclic nucleotide-binding domain-containing protein [Pseudanabaena sp. FACHB-2040]|uniref:cyclic nucleotide-binding domain-containing protein n=1 Tax=Pseudanabaena sp. FACHB-2040 TaxID=2692859 RepID=UPI0016881C2D|nr:cyclic nucleotide-binding domain-containing protein [Pseudanabaena sp. FACHB-2040]MBD2256910.1 cyclic nucleotide-binding domain-containing protein [Pseudanabaena sp. FACHB-2040]
MKRVLFILGVFEDDDVDWLITAGERLALTQGDVLIREGEPTDAIYLLLDGTLHVTVSALKEQVIAELSSGEVVGEMSFVDTQPPSATVAAEGSAVVLAIPCQVLQEKLDKDTWFASRFYKALAILLSSRLRSTVKHLEGEHWRPIAIDHEGFVGEMADVIAVGGIRFDWMLRRLRDSNSDPWIDLQGG